MTLSENQIQELMICGRFNFPATKCIIQLGISKNDAPDFILQFADMFSLLRQAYEKGKINTEFEIMTALENKVHDGGEGADEAAKALGSMRKYQKIDELLSEMYGI